MSEIEKIVVYHNYINNDYMRLVVNNLQTMEDIRVLIVSENLDVVISSETLLKIYDMIENAIVDISSGKRAHRHQRNTISVDINKYRKSIEKIEIGGFIISVAKDLINISLFNQSKKENKKYSLLENEDFEKDEPIKPFFKKEQPLPPYPSKQNIQKRFETPGKTLTEYDKREIDEIFNTKKKQWLTIKNENDKFESIKQEYKTKLDDYEKKKSIYDRKISVIKEKRLSPLRANSKILTPPNNNRSKEELLGDLVGNNIGQCKLDDAGALPTPFTTYFAPLNEYPLYKLQLIVKIHTRDKNNEIIRTDCGNPIDLYNYIVTFYNQNKNPINPYTKKLLTPENINAIMDKLKFAVNDADIETPVSYIENVDKNLFISFSNKDGYYTAFILRTFGNTPENDNETTQGIDIPIYQICSFPSDIGDENSIDRTSAGMAYILDTLFTEERLLYTYMSPYAVVRENGWSFIKITSRLMRYKTPQDWETNRSRKQIEELFFELYDELSRF
jgi:hypothetical protein